MRRESGKRKGVRKEKAASVGKKAGVSREKGRRESELGKNEGVRLEARTRERERASGS